MKIGVPKEIKNKEYRVGLTPASVRELVIQQHTVIIESKAGEEIGFTDEDYKKVGAEVVPNPSQIFADAQMIVKVKEPQPLECKMLSKDQLLFTFLHLAADKLQTELLMQSNCTAVAYETILGRNGSLPILAPMSEVAGRMAAQAGAHCLEKINGGCGVLLGGVPGVAVAKVLILGGGVVGENAARIAVGMGADVYVLDRSIERLRYLEEIFQGTIHCEYSTFDSITKHVKESDLVIGAVLLPGAKAPKLLSRDQISTMKKGSVIVDVAIDQGGCFETSKATTHEQPTYVVNGVVHYCVANIPSAVPKTSTQALNNVTLPYILKLAEQGINALQNNGFLLPGLNVHRGQVTCKAVADAHGLAYLAPELAIAL